MGGTRLTIGVTAVILAFVLYTNANAARHRDEQVYRAVGANRAEALDLLKEIVDIDSGMGDVAGGTKVESVLAPRLAALGGDVTNVPAEAPGLPDSLVAVFHGTGHAKILIIAHIDTVVSVLHDAAYPPLTENPQIDALAARAQSIYSEIGKKIERSGNGGASESAIAMPEGTPALDGLGFVGGDFHTDHEWIDLTSVTPRLYLFTRLLMEAAMSPPTAQHSRQ